MKKLVITPGNTAELRQGERVLWSSAEDAELQDEEIHSDEIDTVLERLIELKLLSEHEADSIECEEESLDGDALDDEDDEDEDEDDFDDEDEDD